MYFLFIFNFLFMSLFINKSFCEDSCVKTNNVKCNGSKVNNNYSKVNNKYGKYLSKIEQAKRDYIPCHADKCNCHSNIIDLDLAPFKTGITREQLENVRLKGTKYQIINHRLYRDKNCMFPARCDGIEHFLFNIIAKLPDLEMIVNTRDWPQIHKHYGDFGPVFSFSKTETYFDIMYPAWAFWEGGPAISLYPRGMGRWDIHRKVLGKLGNETKWEEKIPMAFFRGSRTSSERDSLVLLSREVPDLVNAKYTKNQAWKSESDTLGEPPAEEVSFEEHCKYKYLFNFRGVAASFRFKHILLCKSLVFHVGNEWLEFFYPSLKAWYHYIPVEAKGKEELLELIDFVSNQDEIAMEIAENGYQMIWNHLKLSDVNCYWKKLLKKYAKLQRFEPKLDAELIEIVKKN